MRGLAVAALVAAGLVAFASIPYFYGAALSDGDHVFVGLSPFRSDDANAYLSYLQQTARGAWTLEERFNTEPTLRGRFDLFFLVLGRLGEGLGFDAPTTYRVARVALGWLLLITLYAIAATRFEAKVGLWAMLIAGTSGGVGWLTSALGAELGSFDVRPVGPLVEALTHATLARSPLHLASLVLLLGYYHTLDRALAGSPIATAAAALIALSLTNIHTYDWPVLVVATSGIVAWRFARGHGRRQHLARAAMILTATAPALAHLVMVMKRNPQWGASAVALSRPTPLVVAVSYGLLLLLVAWTLLRRREFIADGEHEWFHTLAVWALVGMIVPCLLPFSWSRKALEGTHLPLALLAAVALTRAPCSSPTVARWRNALLLLAMAPSTLLSTQDACAHMAMFRTELRGDEPGQFVHRDELTAWNWLRTQPDRNAVVLGSFATGNFVAGFSDLRVYCGHAADTKPFIPKAEATVRFFAGELRREPTDRFLSTNRIRFIVYGPRERNLVRLWLRARGRYEFDAPPPGSGSVAYENTSVTIFRVKLP